MGIDLNILTYIANVGYTVETQRNSYVCVYIQVIQVCPSIMPTVDQLEINHVDIRQSTTARSRIEMVEVD